MGPHQWLLTFGLPGRLQLAGLQHGLLPLPLGDGEAWGWGGRTGELAGPRAPCPPRGAPGPSVLHGPWPGLQAAVGTPGAPQGLVLLAPRPILPWVPGTASVGCPRAPLWRPRGVCTGWGDSGGALLALALRAGGASTLHSPRACAGKGSPTSMPPSALGCASVRCEQPPKRPAGPRLGAETQGDSAAAQTPRLGLQGAVPAAGCA